MGIVWIPVRIDSPSGGSGGGLFGIILVIVVIVALFRTYVLKDIGNRYTFKNDDSFTIVEFERDRLNDSIKGEFYFEYQQHHGEGKYSYWYCRSEFVGKQNGETITIVLAEPEIYTNSPYIDGDGRRMMDADMNINLGDNSTINIMGQRMTLEK